MSMVINRLPWSSVGSFGPFRTPDQTRVRSFWGDSTKDAQDSFHTIQFERGPEPEAILMEPRTSCWGSISTHPQWSPSVRACLSAYCSPHQRMYTEGSTPDTEPDECQKKTSCFSNIKIFLVSQCALMLAQGTVGAYLVSRAINTQLILRTYCMWMTLNGVWCASLIFSLKR